MNITKTGIWVIYLRKSRQDDPRETVEEVLAKHEAQLQEYAERELGHRIDEENIYREVASGESLSEREEVRKVLSRIEDPAVVGVLVMEPQRLSRGDLEDCGQLINALRFTKTLVATPYMVYDLENKMERKFFQDELLRGNDFLEYTKEILFRGRVASVKRGNFIGRYAPYGYEKVTMGKDNTLAIVEDEAAVVRLIFDLYTQEDLPPGGIAKRLNELGIPAPKKETWHKDTIRWMLRNIHYAGKVRFNHIKTTPVLENGEVVKKKLLQEVDDMIIAEGKHQAIIDAATWEKAQELVARHPRKKHEHALKNPLSGVLICGKCGKVMLIHPYKVAEDRYECRTRPRCYKSIKVSAIMDAVITALEEAELPALQLKVQNNDGDALKIQQQRLKKLEQQMEDFHAQEDKQYEFLETGRYTQDVFDRRNSALRAKMEECQAAIYQTKATMPRSVDFAARVVELQAAIDILKNPTATPAEQNKVIKAIVERIEFTGSPSDGQNKKRQNRTGVDPFQISVTLRL